MNYLTWKLSEGTWGTGPEGEIASRGGHAEASSPSDTDGKRVGFLTQSCDLSGLSEWEVTEVTEAEALTFVQTMYADAEILADGRISGPPLPSEVE